LGDGWWLVVRGVLWGGVGGGVFCGGGSLCWVGGKRGTLLGGVWGLTWGKIGRTGRGQAFWEVRGRGQEGFGEKRGFGIVGHFRLEWGLCMCAR